MTYIVHKRAGWSYRQRGGLVNCVYSKPFSLINHFHSQRYLLRRTMRVRFVQQLSFEHVASETGRSCSDTITSSRRCRSTKPVNHQASPGPRRTDPIGPTVEQRYRLGSGTITLISTGHKGNLHLLDLLNIFTVPAMN